MQSVVADVQWSVCSLLTAMSGAKTIERRLVTDTDTGPLLVPALA